MEQHTEMSPELGVLRNYIFLCDKPRLRKQQKQILSSPPLLYNLNKRNILLYTHLHYIYTYIYIIYLFIYLGLHDKSHAIFNAQLVSEQRLYVVNAAPSESMHVMEIYRWLQNLVITCFTGKMRINYRMRFIMQP